jgi:UDP-3-O-[3-hydroxymyristoyl] N-acetylglucosamine deacetylase
MTRQSTVGCSVECRGIGLHTAGEARVTLLPAEPDTGLEFRLRSGSGAWVRLPAKASSVVSAARATTLGDGSGSSLSTVEHLLAVLNALEIDNVIVEVVGAELPILDGSARGYLDWVRSAGREFQETPRRIHTVSRRVEIHDGKRSLSIEPAEELSIDYSIDFPDAWIGRQRLILERIDEQLFDREIADARTFGFLDEVEVLRSAGLALGGTLDRVLVVGKEGVLNPSGLRWPDEFVRHKMIDLLGDLMLLGVPLRGRIRVERGGHTLHHRLVRTLLEEEALLVPLQGSRC